MGQRVSKGTEYPFIPSSSPPLHTSEAPRCKDCVCICAETSERSLTKRQLCHYSRKFRWKNMQDLLYPVHLETAPIGTQDGLRGREWFPVVKLLCEPADHSIWVFYSHWLLRLEHLGLTKLKERSFSPFQ